MAKSIEDRRKDNHKEYEKYLSERVPVCIPLRGERLGTSTTVTCGGRVYEIKLGETVSVPRAVENIISDSLKADMEVREKMNALSGGASELGAY